MIKDLAAMVVSENDRLIVKVPEDTAEEDLEYYMKALQLLLGNRFIIVQGDVEFTLVKDIDER